MATQLLNSRWHQNEGSHASDEERWGRQMSSAGESHIEQEVSPADADYARIAEQRRQRERLRKQEARKRQTIEQLQRERARKREARKRQTPQQREREIEREKRRSRSREWPFLAVDGEGGGSDLLGRQHYFLMVASGQAGGQEYIHHNKGEPLSTQDCLEFVLSLPAKPIKVGYGIGYDATQILRGLPERALKRILSSSYGKNGPCYTYWGDYAIIYQQGQYLRVARIDRSGSKPAIMKNSSRTIYETLGFFQCAFVKAIKDWAIGSADERAVIEANKMQRNEFVQLTDTIIGYCKLECRYLAMLMTELRSVCAAAGILPRQWSGAGWLAAALLDKYGIPKRPLTQREIAASADREPTKNPRPAALRRSERHRECELAANLAYYGGRFETSRIGLLSYPVYQYDLRSAYPAAMAHLPCPMHTRWEHRPRSKKLPAGKLCLAKISFSHPDGLWCGLPFRHDGGLFWPLQGTGWYWSPEIETAERHLKADVAVRDLWVAHPNGSKQEDKMPSHQIA
jgi:DNA polymerase type B, organellar and viral